MLEYLFQISKYNDDDPATLRHNLIAHIFDGIFYVVATGFFSVQTVLPVFVQSVGGGTIAIGSVAVLWTIGGNLPQALFLPLTHKAGPVKPIMLKYSLLLRSLFLVLGIFAWLFVGKLSVGLTVAIILLLILLTAIAISLSTPPWFALFTKTVPVTLRGRLLAFRQMVGAGLGIIAGSLITLILAKVEYPVNFALLFVIAFVLSMVSQYHLWKLHEPVGTISYDIEPTSNLRARAMAILRNDRNFRNYLYADALMLMGMTGAGFLAVYGLEKFHLSVASAGTFTAVTMGSNVAANILFGYLGDKYGHKYNMIYLALAVAFCSLVAIVAQNAIVYMSVFFFMACSISLQGISRLPLVAEMCSHEDRPIYVALMNSLTAPTVFIGILAGALINHVGYDIIFAGYFVLGIAAALWLWKKVEEPRDNSL
jgi:MFS family permease